MVLKALIALTLLGARANAGSAPELTWPGVALGISQVQPRFEARVTQECRAQREVWVERIEAETRGAKALLKPIHRELPHESVGRLLRVWAM